MANELSVLSSPGLSFTASLMQGAAVVRSGIAITETGVPGFYVGSVPSGVAAGVYTVLFLSGGAVKSAGTLYWDGASEVGLDQLSTELAAMAARPDPLSITVPGIYPPGTAGAALGRIVEEAPSTGPVGFVPAPPAPGSGMCRVYGFAESADGKPVPNAKVFFTLEVSGPVKSSGRLIAGRRVWAMTDATGQLTTGLTTPWIDLHRNDLLTPGGEYVIDCAEMNVSNKHVTLNTDAADLRDLIFGP